MYTSFKTIRTRSSVFGWGTILQAGRSRVRFPKRWLNFSVDLTLQPHYGRGVESASNRNEYKQVPYILQYFTFARTDFRILVREFVKVRFCSSVSAFDRLTRFRFKSLPPVTFCCVEIRKAETRVSQGQSCREAWELGGAPELEGSDGGLDGKRSCNSNKTKTFPVL
jgi:hypothetical protein